MRSCPPREPAKVQRLGHVVLQSPKYVETLGWYLEHFGLIVSDFKYYDGQRRRADFAEVLTDLLQ